MNSKIYSTVYLLLFFATLTFGQSAKLAFVQNKGQWDGDISYKTDFPGGQALATSKGMLVGIFDTTSLRLRSEWGHHMEDRETGSQFLLDNPKAPDLKGHGWRFHFLNGTPSPQIEGKGLSTDFYNFWVGDPSKHASKVRSSEEITYKNVYTNIDVRYYTAADGSLENDIIIKPNADAESVSFELEGIDIIRQDIDGSLILSTSLGDITIPAPVSYLQDSKGKRTPILVRFVLQNKVVSFSIPNYDRSQTLVIDPVVLRWATWVTNASSADSHNHGTGTDTAGNLYITGRIGGTGLITVGAFQSTSGGSMDVFISKYTEPVLPGGAGTRVWQTFLGGTQTDNNIAMQMGLDGYIYMAAYTSSDLPKTFGSGFTAGGWTQRTASGGGFDQAAIIKLDQSGNGALVREIGSVTRDYKFRASDIRILKTGVYTYELLFSGYITQPASVSVADGDFPAPNTPSGAYKTQPSTAKKNAILMRININFDTIAWIKNIGSDTVGTAKDDVINITATDNSGDIYAAGFTNAGSRISYNNPSAQTTLGGTQDGWILKLDNNGTILWSRYFKSNGSKSTSILSMELNRADTNLIIAGITTGLNALNIKAGCIQTAYGGGNHDLFVAMISKTGSMTNWGTYYGGSLDEDNMMGLNTDLNDDIYFLGYTNSANYSVTGNPLQTSNYGGIDAVFTKINSTGTTKIYSTYYGGANDDDDPLGQRGILFSSCKLYLSITACSNNIPLTAGAITTTKTSAVSISEPVLVSMANPPDILNQAISSNQVLACGGTPTTLTSGVASYNIAGIVRNGTAQTVGTSGAYPSGVPTPSGYQWQKSIDYTYTWTNIAGAVSQNYSPPAVYQTTYFRRIISGDYCSTNDSNAVITVTGTPKVNPSVTCAGSTASFFANPSGGAGSNTYAWTGPLSFSSALQNPQILTASNANNGYYTVTVTDASGCKDTKVIYLDFNSCTYSVVLSVSLMSFDAVKTGETATLKWQTANEQNSESFIIERSSNGRVWESIGTIAAAGNSRKMLAYSFIDNKPLNGLNFYRLRVMDLDGKYNYSNIRNLIFDGAYMPNLTKIIPNPFNTEIKVEFNLPVDGTVSINIIDALGKVVGNSVFEASKGQNTVTFNTENYAKGIYFVNFYADGVNISSKKIVK